MPQVNIKKVSGLTKKLKQDFKNVYQSNFRNYERDRIRIYVRSSDERLMNFVTNMEDWLLTRYKKYNFIAENLENQLLNSCLDINSIQKIFKRTYKMLDKILNNEIKNAKHIKIRNSLKAGIINGVKKSTREQQGNFQQDIIKGLKKEHSEYMEIINDFKKNMESEVIS